MVSQSHAFLSLGLAILTAVAGCKAGAAEGCAPSSAEEAAPEDQGWRGTLEGDYYGMHEVFVYDPETDESVSQGETGDTMSIRKAAGDSLQVKMEILGYNYDLCLFERVMEPSGPHQWRFLLAHQAQTESRIARY